VRPRSFRVGPPDDDEFLAVQPFSLAPQPATSWRVRRIDRLGDDALEAKFASVAEDEFAIASLMAVELEASRLSGEAVSLIVRNRMAAAEFDSTGYSGHSLGAGFATSATQAVAHGRRQWLGSHVASNSRRQFWASVLRRAFDLPRLIGQQFGIALFENAHDRIEQHIAPICNSVST
jgi:hypothetical protein